MRDLLSVLPIFTALWFLALAMVPRLRPVLGVHGVVGGMLAGLAAYALVQDLAPTRIAAAALAIAGTTVALWRAAGVRVDVLVTCAAFTAVAAMPARMPSIALVLPLLVVAFAGASEWRYLPEPAPDRRRTVVVTVSLGLMVLAWPVLPALLWYTGDVRLGITICLGIAGIVLVRDGRLLTALAIGTFVATACMRIVIALGLALDYADPTPRGVDGASLSRWWSAALWWLAVLPCELCARLALASSATSERLPWAPAAVAVVGIALSVIAIPQTGAELPLRFAVPLATAIATAMALAAGLGGRTWAFATTAAASTAAACAGMAIIVILQNPADWHEAWMDEYVLLPIGQALILRLTLRWAQAAAVVQEPGTADQPAACPRPS